MASTRRIASVVLSLLPSVTLTDAFSFAYGPPTQCDLFTISWIGGIAPFSVLLTPVFDNPRNFSVPSTAVNGSSGSFSVQLPLPAGKQFIVAMSDATGFGTGGVSDILTVGSSVSRTSCDTQIPPPGFQFQLNGQLQQCAPYNISGYTGASHPVVITGLIPLGKPIELQTGDSDHLGARDDGKDTAPSWFVWDPANVPAGTSVVFFLKDAAGHFGGSSHVNQVGAGNNACINDQSPMSTANSASGGPTATGRAGSPATSAPTATVTLTSNRASPAVIGGAVAGGLVALLILGSLLVFFFQNYRPRKGATASVTNRLSHRFSTRSRPQGRIPSVDLLQPNSANPLNQTPPNGYDAQDMPPSHWTTFPATPGNDYVARPYMVPASSAGYFSDAAATENGWHDSRSNFSPPPMPAEPSAAQTRDSKTPGGPPSRRPTRLVPAPDAARPPY